jgi:ATPase subunit of ABC transporter with duplicated ATPase domains
MREGLHMKSILTARGLTFDLPNGRPLFQNLTFSLEAQLTALVGPNGVGKTTLAKLLTGDEEPTEGTILRKGQVTFFPQRQTPEPVTVEQFLATNYEWSPLRERLLTGINPNSDCTTLSGGEWMRVRLAKTLDDQYLILDEPTNDLDREGRTALIQFLKDREGGALIISHDRETLGLCEVILELSNQGLKKFGDGWEAYMEAKHEERENLSGTLDLAKRERDKAHADRIHQKDQQEKRNRRGKEAAARGGMPKILLGARKRQAQVTTGRVDNETYERSMSAVSEAHNALSELKIDPVMYATLLGCEDPAQKQIAEATSFNIRFKDWLYKEGLTFAWRGNIRIALKGSNGSGKSTLLKAILGNTFETRGTLRRGDLTTLYIDQRCAVLDDAKTIFENVRDVTMATESEIRNGLAKFLFTKESVFQKVSSLSGGERLRAALARGFLSTTKPDLLILDEPTNNLDLANIEFLENLVREFRGALIVISHDEVFLKNCGIEEELNL